jgi:hypothetical protein
MAQAYNLNRRRAGLDYARTIRDINILRQLSMNFRSTRKTSAGGGWEVTITILFGNVLVSSINSEAFYYLDSNQYLGCGLHFTTSTFGDWR